MSEKILVVEDETDLANTLIYNLEQEGFSVIGTSSGLKAMELAKKNRPALVILDIMLPDISGIEVCRKLRASDYADIPVLMLTARAEEFDKVLGFEAGADDYVTKPFSMKELLLRVKALLRRKQDKRAAPLVFGMLRLDPEAHQVSVNDRPVQLTALEFKLLSVLIERKGRVQSRERLLNDVWGITADVTTRTVDTRIRRLREKLGQAADYIETLRGVGYRFLEKPPGERH